MCLPTRPIRFFYRRKRPFSTGLLSTGFLWASSSSSVVSRVDFIVCSFLVAVGVREHCCTAVGNRVEVRFLRFPRATRASRATNPRPSGLVALDFADAAKATFVALHSAESRQAAYSRRSRCWENVIDTLRCGHLPSHDTHCWRAGLGMCHADLRRAAAAVTPAKSTSALL